jgi:hypothetical protein
MQILKVIVIEFALQIKIEDMVACLPAGTVYDGVRVFAIGLVCAKT